MRKQSCLLFAIVIWMSASVFAEAPADLKILNDSRLPEDLIAVQGMNKVVPLLARFVDALGDSDVTQADKIIRDLHPGLTDDEVQKRREAIVKLLKPFTHLRPDFETVDFVGASQLTSACAELRFIGNGFSGPLSFQFNVYRYKGKWKLDGLAFHSGWQRVVEKTAKDRFKRPLTFGRDAKQLAKKD